MVYFLWRKCYGVVNDAHLSPAVGNKTKKKKRGEREIDDIIKRKRKTNTDGEYVGGRLERDHGGRPRERWRERERETREAG